MSGPPTPLETSSRRSAPHTQRSLREDATRFGRRLVDEIDAQPLHAVVAALVVGFALGGGIPRGAITLLLGVGARAAGSRLGESILENAPGLRTAQENL